MRMNEKNANVYNTCSTKSHKGLGMFPQDLLGGWVDLQLGKEVLNEIMRCDRSQIPLQLVENQQLHLLWMDQNKSQSLTQNL